MSLTPDQLDLIVSIAIMVIPLLCLVWLFTDWWTYR